MRLCVLTTSYPRSADDVAGNFVAEGVEHLRAAGFDVVVVSPADFRHFGIAFGDGIVQNVRERPWLALALPLFLFNYARTARRAAAGADVVHAHWLPSGFAALATGKPFVLQVWGTDIELVRRLPWLARPLLRRARVVIAASSALAASTLELGARKVRVIPNGIDLPDVVAASEEPPHVLFAGRLSAEKGIEDFLEATEGLPRVIVGDGPLRRLVPSAVGFVSPGQIGAYYDRAAVVCVPSRREGFGVIAREAMAHGRAVVATPVGGLTDAIEDGITGLLVDPGELRAAVVRLLGDPQLRSRLGAAARESVRLSCSWTAATQALSEVYRAAAE